MRKPEEDAFKFVLNNHNLNPKKTLFIDDKKENTDVAEQLGLIVWNLEVGKEDVVDLFSKKFNFWFELNTKRYLQNDWKGYPRNFVQRKKQ